MFSSHAREGVKWKMTGTRPLMTRLLKKRLPSEAAPRPFGMHCDISLGPIPRSPAARGASAPSRHSMDDITSFSSKVPTHADPRRFYIARSRERTLEREVAAHALRRNARARGALAREWRRVEVEGHGDRRLLDSNGRRFEEARSVNLFCFPVWEIVLASFKCISFGI
jgi:hypothetical protein